MEKKEVAVKEENTALAVPEGTWGTEGTSTKDILIPKLLLMQGLSKFVADEKAQMGDIVNSLTGDILGGKTKPVEIIPIMSFRTWVIYEIVGDKPQFKSVVPMTRENEDWELEGEEDGAPVRRDKCLNFYVMLKTDMGGFPYLVSFRRTSFRAGKKLVNHFKLAEMKRIPPAANSVMLACSKQQNDDGTFYVFDIAPGKPTAKEDLSTCYGWYKTLSAGTGVRVDNSDLEKDATTTTTEDSAEF